MRCIVCNDKSPSDPWPASKRRYCSDACKQKAYRQGIPPEKLIAVRKVSNDRAKLWRLANPERARELNRKWVSKNRERTRVIARRYAAAHPGYGRVNTLRRQYGLSVADYDAILESQKGLCAICHRPETSLHQSGRVRKLAVDHDHSTGVVRGLLCHDCNLGIGRFRDDPERLADAAGYLRRHSAAQPIGA